MWRIITASIICIGILGGGCGKQVATAAHSSTRANALQILERLGLSRGSGLSAEVTVEEARNGNSPVYYIKLPPLPYYFSQNVIPVPTTPDPFQTVPVDFTNNGRPEQVYHWNLPTSTQPYWPPQSLTLGKPSSTFVKPYWPPQSLTPGKPSSTFVKPVAPSSGPVEAQHAFVDKKPWVNLNKVYMYNGRPDGLYVYKPRPHVSPAKSKWPLVAHFNY